MAREQTTGLDHDSTTTADRQAVAGSPPADPDVVTDQSAPDVVTDQSADQSVDRPAGPPDRRRFPVLAVVTFGLTLLVLLFWWAACYPGRFSPDSLDYMWQSTTGNWNTHHPVSYTALVWLSLQLTDGVAALTLFQSVLMAAGLTYAVTGLRRLGGPGWPWSAAAVAVVVLPQVGVFVMAVWKDVAFVICHVFLLGTMARLLAHRRDGNRGSLPRVLFIPLLVELALIGLFRQNGFVSVLIAIVLCMLLLRRARVRLAVAGMTAVSIALLTNWLLLPTLGVRHSESIVAFESFFSDIALAYEADPAAFPAADTAAMAQVAPLALWRTSGDCYQVDSTVYHRQFDRQAAARHRDELLSVWWHAARRSPGTVVRARICRGSIAWRPTPAGGLSGNPSVWWMRNALARKPAFQASPFAHAVYSRPLDDRIDSAARQLGNWFRGPEWLVWRGATWSYITYLVVGLVAWRRRDSELLALGTITLGLQVSVLLFNAVQAARYMAAPFVLGVLVLPLLVARPVPWGTSRAGVGVQARLDERG